jgi:hypothetical protein
VKKKFAVLQVAAEVAGGEIDRVSEKTGVDSEQSYCQTNLKERAQWTRLNRGCHWSGLPPRGTFLGHESVTLRAGRILCQKSHLALPLPGYSGEIQRGRAGCLRERRHARRAAGQIFKSSGGVTV